MSFTSEDTRNATAYANQKLRVLMMQHLHEKYPHIASHFTYRFRPADTEKDYYVPPNLRKKCYMFDVIMNENVCDLISCNASKFDGPCNRYDTPTYYNVGDKGDYDLYCQPACYNLLNKATFDEEGKETTQSFRTKWSKERNSCLIMPMSLEWLEKPFYRSAEHFKPRLNDLPIGFNVGPYNPNTSSGLTYEYNKSYCDAYFKTWDAPNKTCYVDWLDTVVNAVVGESIVNLVKAGITVIENQGKSSIPQPDLPALPTVPDVFVRESWLSNIDDSFEMPNVDYIFDDLTYTPLIYNDPHNELFKSYDEDQAFRNLIKRNIQTKKNKISREERDKLNESEKDSRLRSIANSIKNIESNSSSMKDAGQVAEEIWEKIKEFIMSVLEGMTTPEFWRDMGIAAVADGILSQIKTIFRQLAGKIIPKLITQIANGFERMFINVLGKTISAVLANAVAKMALKIASSILVALAKIMAAVASVVGIILAIVQIFDLILMFWDPLGFNNMFDQAILEEVMGQSEYGLRNQLKTNNVSLTYDVLCSMMIEQEDLLTLSLQILPYIYEYLDSLEINSEGSRIDKGDEVDVGGIDDPSKVDEIMSRTKLYTSKDIYRYENEHSQRMKYFGKIDKFALLTVSIACIFLILRVYFMTALCILIAVILCFTSYLNSVYNIGKLIDDSFMSKFF